MDVRLDGKVAVVTGASKGIGRAIAAALATSGARVMLSSRKQDALDAAAAAIDGEVATFAANAGEPEQAQACIDKTMSTFGAIDILVNNAATNPYMGPSIDIDLARYDKTFQVNLRGPLVWSQLAYNASMRERGTGSIINIASVGGIGIEPSIGIYNTTKAALIYLTRTLAAELAPVRVNAIAPGLVKTDMARALWEPNEQAIAKHTPMRRLGEPEDIGKAALFFASDMSSWTTGHTLAVDGGALVRPSG